MNTKGFISFNPKSDQCQISPAASPQILHHTVWRTWLFITYTTNSFTYRFLFKRLRVYFVFKESLILSPLRLLDFLYPVSELLPLPRSWPFFLFEFPALWLIKEKGTNQSSEPCSPQISQSEVWRHHLVPVFPWSRPFFDADQHWVGSALHSDSTHLVSPSPAPPELSVHFLPTLQLLPNIRTFSACINI